MLVFPEELGYIRDSVRTVASETFTAVSAPIQYAAIKAYSEDHSEYLDNSRLILKMIGDYIYKELSSVGVICQKPQGGFYMICDFSDVVNKTHEITNDKTLCQKILNDTGFAMLPGSDFGMEEEKLLSRIAFVDFDGSKALEMISKEKSSPDNFLDLACPKILKGISLLKDWIITK
jgi:aspartate aminotransferase